MTAEVHITVGNIHGDKICAPCFSTLTQFYKYRQRVIKSTEYLEKLAQFSEVQEYIVQEDLLTELSENKPFNENLKDELALEPLELEDHESKTVLEEVFTEVKKPCDDSYEPEPETVFEEVYSENKEPCDDSSEDEETKLEPIFTERSLTCEICNRTLKDQIQLLDHFCKHARLGVLFETIGVDCNFYCHLCPELNFENGKLFKAHLRSHSDDDFETSQSTLGFNCKTCLLLFKTKKSLLFHLSTHKLKEQLLYTCVICSVEFSHRSELVDHVRHHDKVAICHKCGEVCDDVYGLQGHKEIHVKTTVCELCGKVLKQSRLREHFANTHETKSHFCDICNKAFSTKHILKTHKRSHFDSEMFHCSIPGCNKRSTSKRDLMRHERFHTDERPYSCNQPGCTKTFKTSSARVEHIRTHTGVKRFGCELCFKRFQTKTLLTNHLMVHSDARPFKCDFCESKFRKRWNVVFHMKKVHKDTRFDNVKSNRCEKIEIL